MGCTLRLPVIAEMLRQLRGGEVSSRELVETCLVAATDPQGEGSRTYLRTYPEAARQEAEAADDRLRWGEASGPLLGVPISIKDLFDVAGEVTTAGSVVLADAAPATEDATVVRRLRQAGAVLIGRTNMTEFAYSGLGLNPHYGTPRNPFDRAIGRIPGGSSSGAAVSVSDGMAAGGIGSDTGGSVRIPAALCGLVGFKPTARRVDRTGMLPLSPSLDSIGPIAQTVDCCARLDAVLAGEEIEAIKPRELRSVRLGVLQGYVLDGLDGTVSAAFARAIAVLARGGARMEEVRIGALDQVPAANQFASAEAFAWHRRLLEREGTRYDRQVAQRIWPGAALLAAEYLDMMRIRREIGREAETAFAGFDAVLLPTTAWVAPTLASVEASDTAYFEANGAMLRNPSLFNYLDGCAATVPCHAAGEAPVGLMVAGLHGADRSILGVASVVEEVLRELR